MRRTVRGMLAALFLLAATGCTVTVEDPEYVAPPALPPIEQLQQAALVDAQDFSGGDDLLSFITEDRTVACSLTAARGPHINLPYEQNSFSDSENNRLAIVPVAHCELAEYPKPAPGDVADDCAGTNFGYLGGAALLTPDSATYGECRSGVTQMEATYGPRGSKAGPLAQLAVLPEGTNLERNGLRCSAYNGGVACGNVSAGVGFFVSRDRYELISRPTGSPAAAPVEPSKTP